ncbi:alpha-ketoglutarate-dependent dioxygenase AlkB family protein [Palleronia caenipelagi]|uniref:Alpha-ketoglutarate-dependent dioxygenase AlkB n=1 Tax=Palleronia caenipelagi TaxID=2489174 RepID=A0A547Q8D8_9RHOB|nr:alpha-ketoglutarate-dependent dioxygenase AlkB [Palleronia caenipelagi]TRD22639.1 alpha-ketoglutarate-dependent dioxygenase AlkB [Palleronia caenipelagi]
MKIEIRGVRILIGALDQQAQAALVEDLRQVAAVAPFFQPETRRGGKLSVRMTSAGSVGWVSDRRGYRYDPRHPGGGEWPAIPTRLLDLWVEHARSEVLPDTCLVNYYGEDARMGLHQDRDEADLTQPVLSVSLGDYALFRIGNVERGGPTESLWLRSGDIAILEGPARLIHHGIDKIRFGSSGLLSRGGRINCTLRVAGISPSSSSATYAGG